MILTLIRRLVDALKKLLGPSFLAAVAIGSGLAGAGLWLAERDARVRQTAELADLKKETSANISTLEAQATAAVREANVERAAAVRDLEGREQKLERNAARLRDEMAALESRKNAELDHVAVLPTSELASRVAARLGLTPQDLGTRHGLPVAPGAAEPPVGDQGSPEAPAAAPVGPGSRPAAPPDRRSDLTATDGSGDRASPAAARAGSNSGAAAVGGETAPAAGAEGVTPKPVGPDQTRAGAQGFAPLPSLPDAAWRKIDSALVEGDACRNENIVLNQEIANLNDRVTTQASMLSQQSVSIEKLNQALAAKDQVLAQTQAEHRAELKVARGTFLGRVGRAVKYVALGVVIGVAIR